MKQNRYENMDQVRNTHTFLDFIKWYKERMGKKKDLSEMIPVNKKPEFAKLHAETFNSITWIGHATFLIQLNGMNILTDPVWSTFMGTTKRAVPNPIPIKSLPAIDYVIISHGHFDHLDFQSIKQVPGNPTYLVPAGLRPLFIKKGYPAEAVFEFNWWEKWVGNDLTFTFTPAQHWVRRGLFDMNQSHWGGWVIESQEKSVYFAGDSGYFNEFKKIKQTMQKIDYAILPIGAYEPEWFMELDHMQPEQAIEAFVDLEASVFIPMHYGTFRLADDTGPEALRRLEAYWQKKELLEEQKKVLPIGSTLWID